MARGVRLPRTAGRPPRFLRTGHRRATSLSEAHLQAAQRDAGHTLGREAEGVLQSLLFHRASRGLRAQRATFRVLAEGDPDVDAALASAVGCSPPPRSLTPPRPPLSDQRARAARLRRCPDCPGAATPDWRLGADAVTASRQMRKPRARGPGEVVVESLGTHAGGALGVVCPHQPAAVDVLVDVRPREAWLCDRTCVGPNGSW